MEGHLFINLILISLLLPTKCCLLSGSGDCGMNGLSYGGRMAMIEEGGSGNGSPPPWYDQRVFIFQMPQSLHKTRSYRSMFGRAGVGRIWIPEDRGACSGTGPQPGVCPFTTEESVCLESSPPCYKTPPSYTEQEPLSFPDVKPTSITVTWPEWDESIDQGSGPIVEYIIEIRRADQTTFSKVHKGRRLFHQFVGLAENTNYEFRVVIIRDHPLGNGPPSMVQTSATGVNIVLNLNLSTSSKSQGLARVEANWSFGNCSDSCGVIGQTIVFQQMDRGNCSTVIDQASAQALKSFSLGIEKRDQSVRRRHAYSLYQVTLTVETHMDDYTISKTIRTIPTEPTGKPLRVRSVIQRKQNALKFSWIDPECEQRHGNITSFEYIFGRNTGEVMGHTTHRRMRFMELQRNEEFSFQVRAVTSVGPGPYSEPYIDRF